MKTKFKVLSIALIAIISVSMTGCSHKDKETKVAQNSSVIEVSDTSSNNEEKDSENTETPIITDIESSITNDDKNSTTTDESSKNASLSEKESKNESASETKNVVVAVTSNEQTKPIINKSTINQPVQPKRRWIEPVYKTEDIYETQPVYETEDIYETQPVYETKSILISPEKKIKHERWEIGYVYFYASKDKKKVYNDKDCDKEVERLLDLGEPDQSTVLSEYIDGPLKNPDKYQWKKDVSTYETIPAKYETKKIQTGTKKVKTGTKKIQTGTKKVKVGTKKVLVTPGHWITQP